MSKIKKESDVPEVQYVTSLALAVKVDDQFKHVQITIAREVGSDNLRCFFDVVDPTKLPKFVEDEK